VLKIHTADGLTAVYDFEDERQAKECVARLQDPEYQANIRGLTITHKGVQYSLPRPLDFDSAQFRYELVPPNENGKIKGWERGICQSGDVRLEMTVHRAQRSVRVTLKRTGKQRFDPWTG
jgi:hypothetical protein